MMKRRFYMEIEDIDDVVEELREIEHEFIAMMLFAKNYIELEDPLNFDNPEDIFKNNIHGFCYRLYLVRQFIKEFTEEKRNRDKK